jgi:protein tyrosine phosphatase (PTP) superfamily phosphohydrolase (DUF442 family)
MRRNSSLEWIAGCVGCFATALLLVVTVRTSADARRSPKSSSPGEAKHAIGCKLTLKGVSNFGEVTPTLYRGAQPSKEGFHNLAKMGINIVVDLRGSRESERQLVTKLGMEYVALPWRCFHPRDGPIAQFLELLRQNPRKKIFVHCRTGDDRTGMDIAAFRIADQGWTAQEAREEMEAFNFSLFHRTICPGLSSYEKKFPQRFTTSPGFENLRTTGHTTKPQSE